MRKITLLLLTLSALLLCSCKQFEEAWDQAMDPNNKNFSWGKAFEPRYVLTVHQEVKYPRASEIEKQIQTFDGKKLWINTNQLFSTKNIKEIRILPRTDRPDTYDIALRLDMRGCTVWTLLAANYRYEKLVLMIDSFYQCRFIPQPLANESSEWVVIEYPFDEVTARGLEKFAPDNYEHFTPSPTRLW